MHAFLTLALDMGEWSSLNCSMPRDGALSICWMFRAVKMVWKGDKFVECSGFDS
jgi:hypothetical protein